MDESILRMHDKNTLKNIALNKGLSRRGFNGRNISRMRKQDFIDFILDQNQENEIDGILIPFEREMVSLFQELIMDDTLHPILQIFGVINGLEQAHKSSERVPNEEDEEAPDFTIKDLIVQEKTCTTDCACETCQENRKINEENLKVKNNLKDIENKITCVVCHSNMRNVIFNPCSHLATCISCSKNPLLGNKCPLCRKTFQNTARIFC